MALIVKVDKTTTRRWRPRFTLRSLILSVCLVACSFGLWWRWEPWIVDREFKHSDEIYSVTFSKDGKSIVTASEDNSVRVWGLSEGKCIEILKDHEKWVYDARFCRNGCHLATASGDGTIKIYEVDSWKCLATLNAHDNQVFTTEFSQTCRIIVSASLDQTARIWDWKRGKCLNVLEHKTAVHQAKFSPSGSKLVTTNSNGQANVWDANTGKQECTIPEITGVKTARFSENENEILTFTGGGSVNVWNSQGQLQRSLATSDVTEFPECWSPVDKNYCVSFIQDTAYLLHRRRPEYWYGVAWLWEFWACVFFSLALAASLWKDYRWLCVGKGEAKV